MKTLDDLGDVRGKRVLVRSDLNVPLDGTTITDDGRIRASVPTIQALRDRGARVVVCAHLGRPKGVPEARYSLAPVVARLSELLDAPVSFASDTVGDDANNVVDGLEDGDVALLENLRFNPGETSKDDKERGGFADDLASLADLYVDDAFGAVHRKHASVYDVPQRLPHAAGGLVLDEVEVLHRLTTDPAPAVRGRPRRREGVRQAGGGRQPARDGRSAAHRRRHGLHLPQGPGTRGRYQPARGGSGRHGPRLPGSGDGTRAWRSCCPST